MLRFLCFILGRPYETCKSCETLKQQLEYERAEKTRLTDTLLEIIHPKVVEAAPVEINQITQTGGLFARRRAALEARDREEARLMKQSTNIGKPDNLKDINKLEQEVGISEELAEVK